MGMERYSARSRRGERTARNLNDIGWGKAGGGWGETYETSEELQRPVERGGRTVDRTRRDKKRKKETEANAD